MRCEYWDCGWCYHDEGPENGCTGKEGCELYSPTGMERIELIGLNANEGEHYQELEMKQNEHDIQRAYNILSQSRHSLNKQREKGCFEGPKIDQIIFHLDEASALMYKLLYPELRHE